MKTTVSIIILFLILTTIVVIRAVYAEPIEIKPVPEPEVFVCECAMPWGQLQAHLDCHDE